MLSSEQHIGFEVDDLLDPSYNNILHRTEVLDDETMSRITRAIFEFADLPTNISTLCKALADKNSSASHIAEMLELNPGLAGKVLKLVNSSFYGLSGKISSLKRAVTILGFEVVSTLVLGTYCFSSGRGLRLPMEMTIDDLWVHSVAVSQIAGLLGEKIGGVDSSMLVSAGLLHDAGKLVLASVSPSEFRRALKQADDVNGDLVNAELRTIGVTHPLLTAALGIKWRLPERLWRTILYQQHPKIAQDKRSAAVLMISEYLARNLNYGRDGQPSCDSVPREASETLGLPEEKIESLLSQDQQDYITEQTNQMHLIN